MRLEGDSLVPLYQQVIDDIRLGIDDGRYQVGQKIPSESELSEIYSVSRITIRRAIEELSTSGYLTKKQGKGTYVNPPKIRKKVLQTSPVQSFTSMCEAAGRVPGARLIERERGLPRRCEAKLLGIDESTEVMAIRRVRTADGIPVNYETVILPLAEFSYLLEEDLNDASLTEIMSRHGAHLPGRVMDTNMELIRADNELAELLEVSLGEPLFDEKGVFADAEGNPLYLGHGRIVASMFSYSLW